MGKVSIVPGNPGLIEYEMQYLRHHLPETKGNRY